jgi:hypothetical protein
VPLDIFPERNQWIQIDVFLGVLNLGQGRWHKSGHAVAVDAEEPGAKRAQWRRPGDDAGGRDCSAAATLAAG